MYSPALNKGRALLAKSNYTISRLCHTFKFNGLPAVAFSLFSILDTIQFTVEFGRCVNYQYRTILTQLHWRRLDCVLTFCKLDRSFCSRSETFHGNSGLTTTKRVAVRWLVKRFHSHLAKIYYSSKFPIYKIH